MAATVCCSGVSYALWQKTYCFVVDANRSSRLHIDAKLMVTQEYLLEPKPINPEDVVSMILK